MRIQDVNPQIIGRRVKGVFTGADITGVIDRIADNDYTVEVHIVLDEPVRWGEDIYTSYWSWARKGDGWGNLSHTQFIDTLDWLKGYMPKDEQFTSDFEMEMIAKCLDLRKLSNEELQEKRNEVVRFYSELKKAETDREKSWDYTTAMMSVTAVIDHFKYQRGMGV